MTVKPFDQGFKYLADDDAESLLLLLGVLKPGDKASIEKLPTELSVSTIIADQLYLVTTEHEAPFIVHVEAQTRWTDELFERLPNYGARAWMKHKLPVHCYVLVLLRKGMPRKLPRYAMVKAGGVEIKARLNLVRLWEYPATQAIKMKRESLLPFVPLMKGGERELERGAELLRQVKDEQKRRDLGAHFVAFGGLRYNREKVIEMILEKSMIPIEQLKESSFYQMILEEGEIEGVAKTLLELVEKHFPQSNLTPDIKRIKDPKTLRKLCLEISDMKSARALQKRIAALGRKV